jgi:hypothetical protein
MQSRWQMSRLNTDSRRFFLLHDWPPAANHILAVYVLG